MTTPDLDLSYSTAELLDSQLAQLQGQISDLARSMQLAVQYNNRAALDQFRPQFRELATRLAALRAQANKAGQPSRLMIALDHASDVMITTGKAVGEDVSNIVKGGTLLVRFLPWLLLLAVIVVGVGLYKGSIKVTR